MAPVNWRGIGADILQNYLKSESGESGSDASSFGLDTFLNGFEDEFPADSDDPTGGMYAGYSPEANRAAENRPWGNQFGDRPKIHELNQPQAAQALGWRVVDFYPNRDLKSDFYRLAGTPAELRQMMQIIQATRFVTGARIDFEAWFEKWENGFPAANQNRSGGNFELTGDRAWERIKSSETRPKYKEFTNSQQRADWGYRVIEYWRDRSVEDSILLCGTDLELIRHIVTYENGARNQSNDEKWLGYPYEEYVYKHPSSLSVQIHMRLTKKPPWEPNSLLAKYNFATIPRPYITIPNVRRDITWEQIRAVCGEPGYNYGSCYAVAQMGEELSEKIGKGGSLKLHAATEQEAMKQLEAFASLSQSRLLTMTSGTERQDKGQRAIDVNFRKIQASLYPAWFIIINDSLVRNALGYGGRGRSVSSGNKLRRQQKIPLWHKPAGVQELIAQLTSKK